MKEIQHFIARHLKEAIELLASFPSISKEVIAQSGRLHDLEEKRRKGILTSEQEDIDRQKIRQALLHFAGQLTPKEQSTLGVEIQRVLSEKSVREIQFTPRRWSIGITISLVFILFLVFLLISFRDHRPSPLPDGFCSLAGDTFEIPGINGGGDPKPYEGTVVVPPGSNISNIQICAKEMSVLRWTPCHAEVGGRRCGEGPGRIENLQFSTETMPSDPETVRFKVQNFDKRDLMVHVVVYDAKTQK